MKISHFIGIALLKFTLLHQEVDQTGINVITLTKASNKS